MKLFKRILFPVILITPLCVKALDKPLEDKRETLIIGFRVAFEAQLPERFESLPGGFSSPGIYKVTINEKPYVVRLSHPNRNVQDEQRSITCLALSSEKQVSPKVHYASAEGGLVIMDYIEPKQLSWEKLTETNNLMALALAIKKLHQGPKFPKFLSIFDMRRSFERMLGEDKPMFLDEISVKLTRIEELLKKCEIDASPCHHDLKLDNLIFDGMKFWVVDWEAACQGNILFDLATAITFMAMTTIQEGFFLKAYFGQLPSDGLHHHLDLAKQVVLSYYGTAYLMVAKMRYQQPPVTEDLSNVPEAQPFIRSHIKNSRSSISSENIQQFGVVFLKQALKNIKHIDKK